MIRPADLSLDMWVGPAPTRKTILKRIKGDKDVENLLFNWSMAELLDKYLTNEKLKLGLFGQGTISHFLFISKEKITTKEYIHFYIVECL
jgi:hypothetical protein